MYVRVSVIINTPGVGSNGTTLEFQRRERPHIVFGEDGVTPVALTNGAGIDGVGAYGDATWTFLQLIQT